MNHDRKQKDYEELMTEENLVSENDLFRLYHFGEEQMSNDEARSWVKYMRSASDVLEGFDPTDAFEKNRSSGLTEDVYFLEGKGPVFAQFEFGGPQLPGMELDQQLRFILGYYAVSSQQCPDEARSEALYKVAELCQLFIHADNGTLV